MHILITDPHDDQQVKDALREIVAERLRKGQGHDELTDFLHSSVEEELMAATATPVVIRGPFKATSADAQGTLFAPAS